MINFRLLADDITPEHRRAAGFSDIVGKLCHKLGVDDGGSLFLGECAGSPFSKVKRFIRAEIEILRGEELHIFGKNVFGKGEALRVCDIERMVRLAVIEGERSRSRAFQFAQMCIRFRAEQLVQMAEACKRRNEINAKSLAVAVQLKDVLCSERRIVAPHLGQIVEEIAVLDVELKLIDFIEAQGVGKLFQIGKRRNTSAGRIVVEAAVFHGRFVGDQDGWKNSTCLADHLTECLHAVENAAFQRSADRDVFRCDSEGISLTG